MIDSIKFEDLFYYDETSPTGLRAKIKRGARGVEVGEPVGTANGVTLSTSHWVVRILGKKFYVHRIIYTLFNGDIPQGYVIDHIDGNPQNNCIENLRLCTQAENAINKCKQANNTSGEIGVRYVSGGQRKKRWVATVTMYGKTHNLGYFETKEEASSAYKLKSTEVFGEFKRNNTEEV